MSELIKLETGDKEEEAATYQRLVQGWSHIRPQAAAGILGRSPEWVRIACKRGQISCERLYPTPGARFRSYLIKRSEVLEMARRGKPAMDHAGRVFYRPHTASEVAPPAAPDTSADPTPEAPVEPVSAQEAQQPLITGKPMRRVYRVTIGSVSVLVRGHTKDHALKRMVEVAQVEEVDDMTII